MGDQRRSSWPWRKLKSSSSASAKATDKSSRLSPSQPVSSASSFKANDSACFVANLSQGATTSTFAEDGRVREANALQEQAEESLRALKQELSNVMREVVAKDALAKQHQKVADEAVSGWEKAEKDALSLKQELESAIQQRVLLEDRVVQLDGALKECMKQVRHVRDEQEGKLQEAITCKTREWEMVKTELEAKQEELQRMLMEADAQKSAMTKSLQERARKILEANEAKSNAETELKVVQVKLSSSEKDISALQYELHLLSKELEIRNEEVAFCKKSADIAHKQHLDNAQKIAKLEADCQRLRILVKKKLPGPAAIAQMRKEVEGLPQSRESNSATVEYKRRSNRSYASSTISFINAHQRPGVAASSSSRVDVDALADRLSSVEEENKMLKEALSKRMGELQTSWLLCAKTASKLSIAEDQLESIQGTPTGARMNGSDFHFTPTREPSIASVSDENGFGGNEYDDEASCAESWASALIGELAHFRKEKITTKEAIKEVTESYKTKESVSSLERGSALQAKEAVQDKEECAVNAPLPEAEQPANVKMGNSLAHQDGQLQALSSLCKDLDHKLSIIEEQLRTGSSRESEKEESSTTCNQLVKDSVISLIDTAHQKLSQLEKAIQGMGSTFTQLPPDHATDMLSAGWGPDVELPIQGFSNESAIQEMVPVPLQPNSDHVAAIEASYTSICEVDESRQGVTMLTSTTNATSTLMAAVGKEEQIPAPILAPSSISTEEESKLTALASIKDQENDSNLEDKHELFNLECSLGFLLRKLISPLEKLRGSAMSDADGAGDEQWEQEKQGLDACKDRFLVGQSSVVELLLRVGMVVCRACHAAASELEDMLASLKQAEVHVNPAGALHLPCHHHGANKPDELDAYVAELGRKLADLEREREELGAERDKLCEEGAQLQAEVALYKKLHSEDEAKCEELRQKLQGFEMDEAGSAMKSSRYEDTKLSKESELVEAKEKLAECERTMVVLGKQLHSLSSLTHPHHSHPHRLPRHQHTLHRSANMDERGSTGPYAFDADVDQPPPRSRGRQTTRHIDTEQYPRFSQKSGPVHVAHSQQSKTCRQHHVDVASWQQPEDGYRSAMSSPARSPAHYGQQFSGSRASAVRTSLTVSLNAAAIGGTASRTKPPTPSASFGKFFSRSKRNR